jgi:hypothetical protein
VVPAPEGVAPEATLVEVSNARVNSESWMAIKGSVFWLRAASTTLNTARMAIRIVFARPSSKLSLLLKRTKKFSLLKLSGPVSRPRVATKKGMPFQHSLTRQRTISGSFNHAAPPMQASLDFTCATSAQRIRQTTSRANTLRSPKAFKSFKAMAIPIY